MTSRQDIGDAPVCESLQGKKAEVVTGPDITVITPRGLPASAEGGWTRLLGLRGSLSLCQDDTDASEGLPMPPAVPNGPVTISLHQFPFSLEQLPPQDVRIGEKTMQ